MTHPYQRLFDTAALEAGNLYCLWRARAMAPVTAAAVVAADGTEAGSRSAACIAVEIRLKRQLQLLACAPAAAGHAALRTAAGAGGATDIFAAGWCLANDADGLAQWLDRANTPAAVAALAAGIACAPLEIGRARVAQWSQVASRQALSTALSAMISASAAPVAGVEPGWRTPPLMPPQWATVDTEKR